MYQATDLTKQTVWFQVLHKGSRLYTLGRRSSFHRSGPLEAVVARRRLRNGRRQTLKNRSRDGGGEMLAVNAAKALKHSNFEINEIFNVIHWMCVQRVESKQLRWD